MPINNGNTNNNHPVSFYIFVFIFIVYNTPTANNNNIYSIAKCANVFLRKIGFFTPTASYINPLEIIIANDVGNKNINIRK